jgi:hypothetical protein
LLRRILPYTSLVLILAALYTGWTFYSRRQIAAEAERQLQQQQADEEQKVVSELGGDQLKILAFGATPGEVSPGGTVVLCYGVSNATRVRIEPGVEPIKPAVSHCLEVFPRKTTTYRLKAEDAKGNSKSASLTIRVR